MRCNPSNTLLMRGEQIEIRASETNIYKQVIKIVFINGTNSSSVWQTETILLHFNYIMERSNFCMERSDFCMERSDFCLGRNDHGAKSPDTFQSLCYLA